ncbi:monocarboxylate transporter 12-B isoform X1 [Patella vulgata]|uniref:monocarboxylate transporter 12-B isoform X1 n=1 Tax=Patella vulgata TaxID=6465 RepID=UPI00217FD2B0|nr:monocarboxylate transporter 12-B isoform X1 [Patella vulgata]
MADVHSLQERSRHPTSESDSTDSSSSESSTISLPPPPDGGYGWLIVVASFLISLICDGCAFSFGVLYTELLDEFGESKSKTSWIGSLFMSVPMILGPLGSALSSKFGCRAVTIGGGIISTSGFVLSSFSNSVDILCVTFGLIAGSGMSVCYVSSMIMVAYYFKKKRALTTGLSVCGSGIGTFIFAPLTEYLIQEYGWRGTLLIIGGIVLNLVVAGALFRPLEFTEEEKLRRAREAFDKMSRTISKQSIPSHGRSRIGSGSEDSVTSHKAEKKDEELELEILSNSQVYLPTFINKQNTEIPDELILEIRKNGSNLEQTLQRYFRSLNLKENGIADHAKVTEILTVTSDDNIVFKPATVSDSLVANGNGTCNSETKRGSSKGGVWQHKKKSSKVKMHRVPSYLPLLKNDIYYRGNLMNLPGTQYRSNSCPELHKTVEEDDDEDDIFSHYPILKVFKISKPLKKFFSNMFDLRILSNPFFLLFAFSNFTLYLWYDVPYVFLTDNAIELGIPEDKASFLLSIIGIVNTIGQILYGVFGDRCVNLTLLYGWSCVIAGLTMVFVPFTSTYWVLGVLGGLFGFFISANYTLQTIMLVQYLSLEKLANAYGLILLTQGIANLVGPPIAGGLYDLTGSYHTTFYAAGVFIILAGMILFITPLLTFLQCIDRTTPGKLQDEHLILTDCKGVDPSPLVVVEIETVI